MTSQHDRDSRELRELCAQRDAARATVLQQAERIAELEKEGAELFGKVFSLGYELGQMEDERDQLRAEVEGLRADAERLDWIEHQYLEDLVMGLAVDCEHDGQYYVCGDDNKTGYGDSLRDALDAARTTHKETE